MLVKLSVSAVNVLARLTAQFDLPARFQSYLCIAAGERDNMSVLLFRFPAESINQLPQDKFDSPPSGVRNGFRGTLVDADLLVFGPDTPPVARFARVVEVSFELFCFFND